MDTTPAQPDQLVEIIGSLADATRLRLLRLLERHELGVAELCNVLQMPQSTVSRHLKLLGSQRWVTSRRHGTTNLYAMILDELDESARRFWNLVRDQVAQTATFKQDQLRLTRLLRQRSSASEQFFAAAADQWEKLRGEMYGQRLSQASLLAMLPSDWVVVDLGCGTGQIVADVAGCVRQVIGVDNSQAMLKAARRRMTGLDNVELRHGDLENLPIDDRTADAALMLLVLSYLPEPGPALTEMRRILKPGGKAVIVDLLRHDREDFRRQMGQQHRGFEPAKITSMLKRAGFNHVICRALPPEPQAKGPALLLATASPASDARSPKNH